MNAFPGSPKLIKGGLALLDPGTGVLQRVISLQYNPDTLTRTLQLQGAADASDRQDALRLKGPPVETIRLEAELDATDQLEFPLNNPLAVETGLAAQLAALEQMLYPPSSRLTGNEALAALGSIEILPAAAPLTVFVWGRSRIQPVRVTEFSATEEAFDTALNPLRAKVTLGMRVLNLNDLPFGSRGGSLSLIHHQRQEVLALRLGPGAAGDLGIGGAL